MSGSGRPDFGHLEIEVTVDDPKAYAKAWTVALRQQFVADTELIDEICAEARSSRSRLNEGTAQAQHGNVHPKAREAALAAAPSGV